MPKRYRGNYALNQRYCLQGDVIDGEGVAIEAVPAAAAVAARSGDYIGDPAEWVKAGPMSPVGP